MIDRAQILKGLLEGVILEIIARGPTYGYEITMLLNDKGFHDLSEGSVYPVLIRLSKKGLLETEMRKSSLGPKRKYFNITKEGQRYLTEFVYIWHGISSAVNGILEGVTHE
jgi:PadR family transcriptional regulator, regulatory protein PadR